jgi:hypothetical protein
MSDYEVTVAPFNGLTDLTQTQHEWNMGHTFKVVTGDGCWRKGQRLTKTLLESHGDGSKVSYRVDFQFEATLTDVNNENYTVPLSSYATSPEHLIALQQAFPASSAPSLAEQAANAIVNRRRRMQLKSKARKELEAAQRTVDYAEFKVEQDELNAAKTKRLKELRLKTGRIERMTARNNKRRLQEGGV